MAPARASRETAGGSQQPRSPNAPIRAESYGARSAASRLPPLPLCPRGTTRRGKRQEGDFSEPPLRS
eukprot:645556-Pyramimonas_sp.AAC.1